MHEIGRIYKVFVWRTEEYLFETDNLHHIIRTSQERKQRLLCLSEKHQWDVWFGGRNVLCERAQLPLGQRECAERLYNEGDRCE